MYFHDLYSLLAARKRKQIESSEDVGGVSMNPTYIPEQGGKRNLFF
jgi:hypothetical protein